MGLQGVELVMAIEDEFGISIPDHDASRLETVGQIYDYVRQRLSATRGPRCVSQATFYRVRAALAALTGVPQATIRPATPLDRLRPAQALQADWSTVARSTGLTLPRLVRPEVRSATNW